jgi:hypothetical protein
MPISVQRRDQLQALAQSMSSATALSHDPRFAEALDELTDDARVHERARTDPAAYLKAKGVALAEGAEVTYHSSVVSAGDAPRALRWSVTVCYRTTIGGVTVMVCVTYSSDTGLGVSVTVIV